MTGMRCPSALLTPASSRVNTKHSAKALRMRILQIVNCQSIKPSVSITKGRDCLQIGQNCFFGAVVVIFTMAVYYTLGVLGGKRNFDATISGAVYMTRVKGIFNILATPFDSDYAVDYASLRRLVRFQLGLGAQGLTILGVMGEAAKLSVDERRAVMNCVIDEVAGAVPIVVGTSHAQLGTCIALSQAAFAAGADGVMIAPPRLEDKSAPAILVLYERIAEQVAGEIVVQDFPPVNDVIMSPGLLAQIARRIPQARTLKLEDPPLMQKITAIREQTDLFAIFGGLGGMFLLEELNRGAAGTMTGFAFTEILVAVHEAFIAGEREKAAAIFDTYAPLIRYENQPGINLAIRKALLQCRGAIANATPRPPFAAIDAGTQAEIDWLLQRVGVDNPREKLPL
ncbi:MAG: dihydrodipicolinate synthase family protein [Chloroflexi bacterium]|nr:dihydrodipicolinate synthase family protein [Chloroflexota bacterium]MXX84384.1 dihydrodipicolinate synthase family protein [Chloroflexota bacterium]MYA92842.1 dihydrodipicolinate synthase family protein [Chloroflexota bacterium]MYC56945.1 dihydrodipicolinate synthase family protein [Chloroflexota bacterium]MYD37537.1 dihydrodipicolinate synthase family protein [Chloroflexota bacterium]